jgi:RimJ/RimL family protein N-acetyltransferase
MVNARVQGPTIELGYALAHDFWRQGLMSEVLRALLPWFLAQESIRRVWAFCDAENIASARLLERVGMQWEGVLRQWMVHPNLGPEPRDCIAYAIVKTRD